MRRAQFFWSGWPWSRRGWVLLALTLLLGAIALMPLRTAVALAGWGQGSISARQIIGPMWWGGVDDLSIGGARIGTVDAWIAPGALLTGRAELHLRRQRGQADDIAGILFAGFGHSGVRDLTGTVPTGTMLKPLPVTSLVANALSVRFAAGRCSDAGGTATLNLGPIVPGLNLSNGMTATASCRGDRLQLPFVSQSGMERIDLSVSGSGAWQADVTLASPSETIAAAARSAGFAPRGQDLAMTLTGQL